MKIQRLFLLFLLAFSVHVAKSQNPSDEEAKKYFSQLHTNHDMMQLAKKSVPTLAQCMKVFTPEAAQTYFDYLKTQDLEFQASLDKPLKQYVDVGVRTCTTEDIQAGKGNYPGGMASISDKLLPKLLMAKIKLLENVGDKFGLATMMWIQVDGKWLYFPDPWTPFMK